MTQAITQSHSTTRWLLRALLLGSLILGWQALPVAAKPAVSTNPDQAWSQCPETDEEVIVDLEDLARRIKKTRAVGMMTKLKLNGEINKLLAKVEAYHAGKSPYSMEQLREQFDLLYMKIVSLAQDKDIDLHHQLCSSWDIIWGYLYDRERFDQISDNQ